MLSSERLDNGTLSYVVLIKYLNLCLVDVIIASIFGLESGQVFKLTNQLRGFSYLKKIRLSISFTSTPSCYCTMSTALILWDRK